MKFSRVCDRGDALSSVVKLMQQCSGANGDEKTGNNLNFCKCTFCLFHPLNFLSMLKLFHSV